MVTKETKKKRSGAAAMAAAVDWSKLPQDLLNLISQRLDNDIDLIRFRSICSNWRSSSSIPNNHVNILSLKFLKRASSAYSMYMNTNIKSYRLSKSSLLLSKRSLFLIKPPQQDQTIVNRPWLIRVTQNSSGKKKLSRTSLVPLHMHSTFLISLNLNKFSFLHFGTDFIVDVNKGQLACRSMYPRKVVVVTPHILGVLLYNDRLVLYHCGDERWIDILSSIEAICVFKGRIYAVEQGSNKTFTIRPDDLRVQLVAKNVDGGGRYMKFLVESEGELLLVDVDIDDEFLYFDDNCFENGLKLDVYKLDEKEKEWVKLNSLGDRVLFLGDGYLFSASASDLSVAKGNCIIFISDVIDKQESICDNAMCVFHLDQGQLSRLSDYPDYLNLFWPPPEWIVNS